MHYNFISVVLAAFLFIRIDHCGVSAQQQAATLQSILWNIPDGDLDDLSQTFTAGTTLALSWNKYNSTQYVDTTKNLVYLWVSSFDFNTNPYSKLLRTNINMTQAGNFAWTIDIPDSVLAISAKYVLRFKLPVSTFDFGAGELSSPGFLVLRSTTETSTSSTSSQSTSTSTSSATTLVTSTPISSLPIVPTQTPPPSDIAGGPSPGMSSGEKAGVGIGISILALGIIAAVLFFIYRKRRNAERQEQVTDPYVVNELGNDKTPPYQYYTPVAPVELSSRNSKNAWNVAELPGNSH